ncbi:MAG TPA: sulfurtransferase [Arenimonas sp.]|nr:sulfurtransferase [Arenimonas sp.]
MSIISVEQLALSLSDANTRIIDARYVLGDAKAGYLSYLKAHIPGALYVSLDDDLSSEKTNPLLGRHPLPSAEKFSTLLSRLGIHAESRVIVYDQSDAAMAASRFWFLMRMAGHKNVSVLNGGMNAWLAAQLPVEQDVVKPSASNYPVQFQTGMLIEASELKALLKNTQESVLIDARAPERFRGEVEPLDKKAGHIPGAVNRPLSLNMQDGLFKSPEQLRVDFAPFIEDRQNILLSCGSGVTACHNALALSHAGIEYYRLFAPSWSGWVADEENPVAIG